MGVMLARATEDLGRTTASGLRDVATGLTELARLHHETAVMVRELVDVLRRFDALALERDTQRLENKLRRGWIQRWLFG